MRTPQGQVTFVEPTPADARWTADQLRVAGAFVVRYLGASDWAENDLATLDLALDAWSRDSTPVKPAPAVIAGTCGVAVGAFVARRVGLKWMIAGQGVHRQPAVWGRSASGSDVAIYPIALAAQRIEEGLTAFLAELAEGLCELAREDLAR